MFDDFPVVSNYAMASCLHDFMLVNQLSELATVKQRRMQFKVVRNKQSKFFSHRYLIEFYETNRMSHLPHLYDIVILLK